MANIKITDLSNFADPNSTDVLPIVDVANDETKKVSIGNLMKSAVAGTAALPGVAFAVDEDTGMYRNASDQLAFATGGVERILIDDSGVVTIAGDLTVNGTTTTIDSTTLTVEDKNIELGVVDTPSDTTADGGGITLKGATDKTLNWVNSTDSWTSSENVDLASGKTYKINGTDVLSGSTLGSGVTGSSLTSVGTITTGVWNGTALTADAIGADAINGDKIADDSIDSEHYVDGSIDNVHVSASAAIAGTKISADFGAQDLTVDTNVLHVSATSNHVGIGTTNAGSADLAIVRARDASNYARFSIGQNVDGQGSTGGNHLGLWYGNANSDRADIFTSAGDMNFWVDGAADGTGQFTFGRTFDTEWMRIDDSGRLLIGTNTTTGNQGDADLLIRGTTTQGELYLSRGGTPADNGGGLGFIAFTGGNGADAAFIRSYSDGGTWTNGSSHPSSLRFDTTADGESTPTERMRIDNQGNVSIHANRAVNRARIILSAPDDSTNLRHLFGANLQVDDSGTYTTPATSISGGGWLYQSANSLNDHGDMIYMSAPDTNAESSTPLERLRIDPSGRLLVGTSTSRGLGGSSSQQIQVEGTDGPGSAISLINNQNSVGRASIRFGKSRGADVNTNTIVADDDFLGDIIWCGADDTDLENIGGRITCQVDGTPGSNVMPGSLVFYTNDGTASATPTERMRIDSSGNVGIGQDDPQTRLHIYAADPILRIQDSSTSIADGFAALQLAESGADGVLNNYWQIALEGDSGTSTDHLTFKDGTGERMRIDSSGRLLVGTTTAFGGNAELLQIARNGGGGIALLRNDLTVSSGNELGAISWYGNDSTETTYQECATIRAFADGDHADDDKPTRLVFSTTADGESSPTERMRIDSSGRVGIGIPDLNASRKVEIVQPSGYTSGLRIRSDGSGAYNECFSGVSNWRIGSPHNTNALVFLGDGNERARIDSSGRLLVGHSSNSGLGSAGAIESQNTAGNNLVAVRYSNNTGSADITMGKSRSDTLGTLSLLSENDSMGTLAWRGAKDGGWRLSGDIQMRVAAGFDNNDSYCPGYMVFRTSPGGGTSPQERMRIQDDGHVLIARTSYTNISTNGHYFDANGWAHHSVNSDAPLYLNRNTNDGYLVRLYQAGTMEGNISVSGTTVSYNGAHLSRYSQLPGGAERAGILRGSVLSNIDEMCEWGEEENEQLNRMKVSDVEGDRNVSGVFQSWDDEDDTYTNDFFCAMTGDFVIRIGQGVTVERGDLLMSAGDGTAKPQDDDIIRSKTIAKVTSTNVSCTYDDGSYCVPCVLMAC